MHSHIQCTLVSKSKLKSIKSVDKNENSPQVSTNVPVEMLVEKMMISIMNQVDEKIRVISENSLSRVSDQSFSFFSGEDPPNINEKTYDQWIFDVKTIRPSYPKGLLKESIFGSLKGNAADIARGLGPDTTMD